MSLFPMTAPLSQNPATDVFPALSLAGALEDVTAETYTRISQAELLALKPEAKALALMSAEVAWDAMVLPVRFEGDVLIAVATEAWLDHSRDAVAAFWRGEVEWLLTDAMRLEQVIATTFDYEGLPDG